MVKFIVAFVAGTLMMTATASAEVVKIATRNFDTSEREHIIDTRQDVCGLKAVSFAVSGFDAYWLWDATVAYRADKVTRDVFHVNQVLKNSSTGWIQLKKEGLCVRRFYVELEGHSSTGINPTITIYGLR